MISSPQTSESSLARVVYMLLAWLAWIAAGTFVFHIPEILRQSGGILEAVAIASPRVKLLLGIWVLGSIVLFAVLLAAIQNATRAGKKR